jgi:hypothetical protein
MPAALVAVCFDRWLERAQLSARRVSLLSHVGADVWPRNVRWR